MWRIYFPQRRTFRFLSNWGSNQLQGSNQLPKHSDHCIIIKSLKDVMTCDNGNIVAIAPCSETVLISENVYNKLKLKYNDLLYFFSTDFCSKFQWKERSKFNEAAYCYEFVSKWGR